MAIAFELKADKWPNPEVDPYIRLAVALIENEPEEDKRSLIGLSDELDVLAELTEKDGKLHVPPELDVPKAYAGQKFVAGSVPLIPHDPYLRKRIVTLREQVDRLKLSVRQQPRLKSSLKDMGLDASTPVQPPVTSTARTAPTTPPKPAATGSGVVVGIIDDGCAFAHYNFLNIKSRKPFKVESRVLYLWDQTPDAERCGKWNRLPEFGYGRELNNRAIDGLLARYVDPDTGYLREDAVYKDLGYPIDVGSHGTHVMDIAAGNGNSGTAQGVAPDADIIFVQIPKTGMGNPEKSVLTGYLLDGINYIFSKAGKKPAVINISYGGYGGPHDGTSLFECAMDELLKDASNRAIVISAGNAFDVNCHASGDIAGGADSKPLRWLIGEDDPTLNMMEVWYDPNSKLKLKLTPPGTRTSLDVELGHGYSIQQEKKIVGWIFHRKSDSGKKDNHILIALRPSRSNVIGPNIAPAPSGTWTVQLCNEGTEQVTFHAWIERDDGGSRKAGKKLQSCFAPDDASRECTLGSFSTGLRTIVVGGYNTATGEICPYSACGPTRDGKGKPDVCAPAEEDVEGRGVMCATSLSGQPTAMNGTSAAAPHVAGLVALMLDAAQREGKELTVDDIRKLIMDGASETSKCKPLKPNSRQQAMDQFNPNSPTRPGPKVDPNSRPRANEEFLQSRIGTGRIYAPATLDGVARIKRPRGAREL